MRLRLILDPPRSARMNMAVDEMLMDRQRSPGAEPCLRLYAWDAPAITCGYFQDVRKLGRRYPESEIVRRITGGGLVRHGEDLTFSLAIADTHPFFPGAGRGIKEFYLKVSEALRLGLGPRYPGLDYADCRSALSPRGRGERVCFDQPACYDLLIGQKKVAGSSQRHTGGAVLYQSSVFLPGAREDVAAGILEGFRASWKADFETAPLTAQELEEAEKRGEARYLSEDWRFLPASFFSKHSGQL